MYQTPTFPIKLFKDKLDLFVPVRRSDTLEVKFLINRFYFDHSLRIRLPLNFALEEKCIKGSNFYFDQSIVC